MGTMITFYQFQNRSRKSYLLSLILSASLLSALEVQAYCGLEHCPIISQPQHPDKWAVGLSWRMVSFKKEGKKIGFQQVTTRLEWRPSPRFILGSDLPITLPLTDSKYLYGFSNPLVFAEAVVPYESETRLAFGSQFELPYGGISKGFATNHLMAMPYAVVSRFFGAISLSTRLGWGTSIPYRAPKPSTPSSNTALGTTAISSRVAHVHQLPEGATAFVEPHSNRDLLYRIAVAYKAPMATTEIQISGAHAFEAGFSPQNAFSTGLSVAFRYNDHLTVLPELRLPLTQPARFEKSAGLGFRATF